MTPTLQNLAIFLMLTGSASWAQGPGGPGGRGPMRTTSFQALDTDGDGTVSASELAKAAASLKVLDKNGDGKLTEDEVRPVRGPRGEGGREGGRDGGREGGRGETAPPGADDMVKSLMAFDKNGDGKLTRDEVPERMQGLFARADADKDGVLTADEIRKVAQVQAAPAGRSEGRGEGRGGEGRGGPGGMTFMRIDPILAALDADGDGVISAEELLKAPQSLLKLDKNQDGKLSEDEVRPAFGRDPGARPERN